MYGYFGVSWQGGADHKGRVARQRRDLHRAAASGCSLMHLSHLGDVVATRSLLDLAHDLGVAVILEDLERADAALLAGHPAFLALNVGDDANTKPLDAVRGACLAAPAGLPRYLSMYHEPDKPRPDLFGLAEIVGMESYTATKGPLSVAYTAWTAGRQFADRAGNRFFAVLQVHDIGSGLPSADYVRAQVWLAAACGADALLAYTMLDGGGPVAPHLHEAFVASAAEVQALTSGRARVTARADLGSLTATWPGGVSALLSLGADARVLNLNRR